MAYRTIKFAWLPSTCQGWLIYTSVRKEAARLWSWLVERHATIRQLGGKWPSKADIQKEIKGLFPGLHSQSVQQIVADFCEAVASAESLRKRGEPYEYPHRKTTYRQVLFTNQAPRFRDGRMVLPCGKAGSLEIHLPRGVTLPGRMMEVRLGYGSVEIVCEVLIEPRPAGPTIGVDLGSTRSSRPPTATRPSWSVAGRSRRQSNCGTSDSPRSKRSKSGTRRGRDGIAGSSDASTGSWHTPGTRSATCATRRPARLRTPSRTPRRTSVSRSTTPAARWIGSVAVRVVGLQPQDHRDAALQARCLHRGRRALLVADVPRLRRTVEAPPDLSVSALSYEAPRDVVGCSNIRVIGIEGGLRPGCPVPNRIHFVHPSKYPGVRQVAPGTPGKLLQAKADGSGRCAPPGPDGSIPSGREAAGL